MSVFMYSLLGLWDSKIKGKKILNEAVIIVKKLGSFDV